MGTEYKPTSPDEEIPKVKARVAEIMEVFGLTNPELAKICGVGENAVSQWLPGNRNERLINLSAAYRLCAKFGITLDFIYRNDLRGLAPSAYERILQHRKQKIVSIAPAPGKKLQSATR